MNEIKMEEMTASEEFLRKLDEQISSLEENPDQKKNLNEYKTAKKVPYISEKKKVKGKA